MSNCNLCSRRGRVPELSSFLRINREVGVKRIEVIYHNLYLGVLRQGMETSITFETLQRRGSEENKISKKICIESTVKHVLQGGVVED